MTDVTVKENGEHQLFKDVPRVFKATRYHSLEALRKKTEDEELVAVAGADVVRGEKKGDDNEEYDDDDEEEVSGTVMALKHRVYPQYGVQFHPESICTEPHGKTIVKNFMDIADAYWKERDRTQEEEEEEEEEEGIMTISEERKDALMKLANASRQK